MEKFWGSWDYQMSYNQDECPLLQQTCTISRVYFLSLATWKSNQQLYKAQYMLKIQQINIITCDIHYSFLLTCMIRKCGLFTFNETDLNRSWTREGTALLPLMRYLLRPPITTCLETVISSNVSYPSGLWRLSTLLKVMVTVALVTPACPPL